MSITAIVPRLLPAIDGVGDYAWQLASHLRHHFATETRLIVGDPTWVRSPAIAPFQAQPVKTRSRESLLAAIDTSAGIAPNSQTILLHYVPHGYAKKACPFWLVNALEQWRSQQPNCCLITFFHELYALDWHRPWSSDFWLSPVQQHLAARLAHISDVCLTSTERYTQTIAHLSRGKHSSVTPLPIFSNVGEPIAALPLAQRPPQLVIFGQCHSKGRIYRESMSHLEHLCRSLAIEQIIDIGPQTGLAPRAVAGVPLQELGELPKTEVSHLLARSRVGFLTYDPWRLSKSGVFAAYCAYGVLPVNHQGLTQPVDGLLAGTHYYVSDPTVALDLSTAQAIGDRAQAWYHAHRIETHAQTLLAHLPPHSNYATATAIQVV